MESPCVKICSIDPATKRCTGCLRTLEEIRADILALEKETEGLLSQILGGKA